MLVVVVDCHSLAEGSHMPFDQALAQEKSQTRRFLAWCRAGRAATIEATRVRELKAQGISPTDIAKALKIGRASVYRVLGAPAG
jgi:DNA invertase Pin-like site-specific DNA recombinase